MALAHCAERRVGHHRVNHAAPRRDAQRDNTTRREL